MIPELEKPKILEIKVRMDCNGCVQKVKKALHGINGIYDLYIDFPQQKLTIIGWADPERIMKAIKKTRKIATICSESEQTDPQAAAQPGDNSMPTGGEIAYGTSMEAPPHDAAMVGVAGMPGYSHGEVAPGHVVVQDAQTSQPYDPNNPNGQHAQPIGSHEVGQVHVTYGQPVEQGHVVHHGSSEPGHVVHHQGAEPSHFVSHQPEHGHVVHQQQPEHGHGGYQQSPMHGHVVHHQPEHGHVVGQHQPTDHGHVVHHQPTEHSYGQVVHHQPTEHSYGQVVHHQPTEHSHGHVVHHQPTEHSHGHVVHHQPTEHSYGHAAQPHQFEHGHGHTSSYNYHNNMPGTSHGPTSMPQATVIHSYNTYQPSPYVTEYVRPLTSHRPSPYAYEYIPQQPATYYSPRMDRYNDDYYNTGTSSNNGNITSIFSDENPNACNLM